MKQDITKYFVEIFVKMTLVSDFLDYCCSSVENKNTLAIERRKHFK